jgi:transcription-repair coupling factor (superfamily II helicase)
MKIVTEIASKRLTAMKEFTQFGSGFRIAMRDLEIRGAGNVLGTSQHGHMEDVGYEMYIKLLNEAIAELKGEISEKLTDCRIDIKINAHIPEDYIESLNGRLEIYRKIANVENIDRKEDLIDELIDRFGTPPDTIIQLIEISLARNIASELGIKQISRKKGQIELAITVINPRQVAALQDAFHNRITFNGTTKTINVLLAKAQPALELTNQILVLMVKYK